jgi:hypothetical protein
MPNLYDLESGTLIGSLTSAQLAFLIAQLEEEDSEDRDYYIDRATLDWFEEQDADPALMTLLRGALGGREGMDIRWQED